MRPIVHRLIPLAVFIALLIFASALGFPAPAQSPNSSQLPQVQTEPRAPGENENNPGIPPELQKEMQKKANLQRHADLKRDTDRLLKLSQELKEYVDKSNENVLSLDVIKKADEIEKLAHSVRTKMRGNN
jgi:hypothetical protein